MTYVLVYGLKPKRLSSTVRPTAYLTYSKIAQIRILAVIDQCGPIANQIHLQNWNVCGLNSLLERSWPQLCIERRVTSIQYWSVRCVNSVAGSVRGLNCALGACGLNSVLLRLLPKCINGALYYLNSVFGRVCCLNSVLGRLWLEFSIGSLLALILYWNSLGFNSVLMVFCGRSSASGLL